MDMSRTKKFLNNTKAAIANQVVMIISGFVLPWIFLQYFGSEINGLISSITQFFVYFALVEAGIFGAAVFSLYKPLVDNDTQEINVILSTAKHLYFRAGLVFIVLSVLLAVFFPLYFTTDQLSSAGIAALVLILGANGGVDFFFMAKYRILLTADQSLYIVSLATSVQITLFTLIVYSMAASGAGILLLRLVAIVSVIAKVIILKSYAKKKYPQISYEEKVKTEKLSMRGDVLYLQTLGAIQNGAPIIILTFITHNMFVVSVYSIYSMVTQGLNSLLSVFTSGLQSSFGDAIARNEKSTLQKAYSTFEFAYYGLITVVYATAFLTIMPFIALYTAHVSDYNYNFPMLGVLMVVNGYLYNIKTPQGMLILSAGHYKQTRLQTTVQSIIALTVGIIGTFILGIEGVVIGMMASNIYRDVDLFIYVPNKITGMKLSNSLRRVFCSIICLFAICIPVILLNFSIDSPGEWVVYTISIFIFGVIVVTIFSRIFEYEELKRTFDLIRKRGA
jgi:hypothetical protein